MLPFSMSHLSLSSAWPELALFLTFGKHDYPLLRNMDSIDSDNVPWYTGIANYVNI